jgi:hypothetical protein
MRRTYPVHRDSHSYRKANNGPEPWSGAPSPPPVGLPATPDAGASPNYSEGSVSEPARIRLRRRALELSEALPACVPRATASPGRAAAAQRRGLGRTGRSGAKCPRDMTRAAWRRKSADLRLSTLLAATQAHVSPILPGECRWALAVGPGLVRLVPASLRDSSWRAQIAERLKRETSGVPPCLLSP